MQTFLFLILGFFSLYYFFFIARVYFGLRRLTPTSSIRHSVSVSIVIAARNEEARIESCIRALLVQTYPIHFLEIIIVDDGSSDKTASLVSSYAAQYPFLHLLSMPAAHNNKTGRKPAALAKGIEKARGEIILTTDADCIVPPRWVEIMVNHFDPDVVFVAGPVAEIHSHSFLARLEQLEFLGLITTAAGLIGSGRPIICNGANLAYRKDAFIASGGCSEFSSSNDDESFMNKIAYRKIGKIKFAPEADALVTTDSSNTLMTFLYQRLRWANKRGHYEDPFLLFPLLGLYMFFASTFFTFILTIAGYPYWLPLSLAFGGKVAIDSLALQSGARLFRQTISLPHFLVAELLHVPYIVLAAALGQIASIPWKGRSIRR